MERQRLLVTGGAGFIGSHIQDLLIAEGHDVAILDNLSSGKKENINPKATLYEVDIRDKDGITKVFHEVRPQGVFHLAAQIQVPKSIKDPIEDLEINTKGMLNLLQAAVEVAGEEEKPKFVYSNTAASYGTIPEDKLPVVEDQLVLQPSSGYGISKLAAEYYLRLFGDLYGIPWRVLRYANVYGERQAGNHEAGVIAIFIERMLRGQQITINGDGTATRDFVNVKDVARANVFALRYPHNDIFNIATGKGTSIIDVYQLIEDYLKTGFSPIFGPERPGDIKHNRLSPQRAKDRMGWEPQIPIETGIRDTLVYYQNAA